MRILEYLTLLNDNKYIINKDRRMNYIWNACTHSLQFNYTCMHICIIMRTLYAHTHLHITYIVAILPISILLILILK